MRPEKESVLVSISDHTEVMHQALEGKNLPFEERMIYLGHLGMCARLFKAVCLDESRELIDSLVRIEQSSFRLGTPSDQRGLIARESWSLLEPVLLRYLTNQTTQAEQRAWQHPLAPLFSMFPPDFNPNPAINVGSR